MRDSEDASRSPFFPRPWPLSRLPVRFRAFPPPVPFCHPLPSPSSPCAFQTAAPFRCRHREPRGCEPLRAQVGPRQSRAGRDPGRWAAAGSDRPAAPGRRGSTSSSNGGVARRGRAPKAEGQGKRSGRRRGASEMEAERRARPAPRRDARRQARVRVTAEARARAGRASAPLTESADRRRWRAGGGAGASRWAGPGRQSRASSGGEGTRRATRSLAGRRRGPSKGKGG